MNPEIQVCTDPIAAIGSGDDCTNLPKNCLRMVRVNPTYVQITTTLDGVVSEMIVRFDELVSSAQQIVAGGLNLK